MNNIRNAIFFLLLLCTAHVTGKTFYGTIQFPEKVSNPPALMLFYNGQQIRVDTHLDEPNPKKGHFKLQDDSAYTMHILVAEDIQLPRSNEFDALETSHMHSYKLYKLTISSDIVIEPSQDSTKRSYRTAEHWDIEEMPQTKNSIKLPENTLILLINPELVTIEPVEWDATDPIIKLPKIIIKQDLDAATMDEIGTRSLFKALDYKILHKRPTESIKSAHNRILSIANPQQRFAI